MKAHLKYLSYVVRHKWFVFKNCVSYGIIRQGIVHDLSKFSPSEWGPYVRFFYGKFKDKAEFDKAWNHHIHSNPHHWQYWTLRCDSGGEVPLEMPFNYLLEMIADWKGAGQAQGSPDTKAWYLKNKERIILHPKSRALVEYFLGL